MPLREPPPSFRCKIKSPVSVTIFGLVPSHCTYKRSVVEERKLKSLPLVMVLTVSKVKATAEVVSVTPLIYVIESEAVSLPVVEKSKELVVKTLDEPTSTEVPKYPERQRGEGVAPIS